MDDEKLGLLNNIRLFQGLTPAELRAVAGRVRVKEFQRDSVILHESESNEYMYAVLRGRVKAYQVTPDGRQTVLALRGEGESFGELSLIDGMTEPAAVASVEDSTIAIISRRDFDAILASNERISRNLLLMLCSRVRDLWKRTMMLNFKNAAHRMRMFLVLMGEDIGVRTDDGVLIDMRLTHQSMAEMSGLTRETVTRVLDKLANDGEIIVDSERRITLKKVFFSRESVL